MKTETSNDPILAADRYTHRCLTVIACMLGLLVIGLYARTPSSLPSAEAQYVGPSGLGAPEKQVIPILPDSAAQRDAMIAEQKGTNARLDEILRTLTSGKVKVEVTRADDSNEGQLHALPPKSK